MGAFLDKPIVEKEYDSQENEQLRAFSCSMQGWRVAMEDAYVIRTTLPEDKTVSFFGVFDGHGGVYTSELCRKELLDIILSQPEYKGSETTVEDYEKIMKSGYLAMDEFLRSRGNKSDHSGSTAVTAFITHSHIIVANCGDSRCVLSRESQSLALSHDHKPANDTESERITQAGGSVIGGRVNGELAVSRSLGDFMYKMNTHISAECQLVSAMPDVKVIERVREHDEYMLFACDGIWDILAENQDCVNLMTSYLKCNASPEGALEDLLDYCLDKNSKDNMTALLVLLDNAPKPVEEQVKAHIDVKAKLKLMRESANTCEDYSFVVPESLGVRSGKSE